MKRPVLVLLVLLAVATALPGWAQSVVSEDEREAIRGVPDRWGLDLGSFWQTFDTRLRLYGADGESGTDIDAEKDLGLPDNATNFVVNGFYRFSDHSRLDLLYGGWSRTNTRTLEEQIEWGDTIYDVGATLSTDLNARLLNVIYKYSFFNNGKVTFGLNGGISAAWTEIELSGEGHVEGGGSASGTLTESEDAIFPIPVLGVHFELTLVEKLFWKVDGNFFAAKVSGYDGGVNEISTSISYFFTRNVGAGAGFSSVSWRLEKTGDRGGELDVRMGFSGVNAYVRFAF
jgi:hypothetical protein